MKKSGIPDQFGNDEGGEGEAPARATHLRSELRLLRQTLRGLSPQELIALDRKEEFW